MLTKTLQELEADGMLIRKSYNTVPLQVDYTLIKFGAHVRRRQLLHKFTAAFAPPKRRKLYQLLRKFIPV